jgi:rhomboid protease GluP
VGEADDTGAVAPIAPAATFHPSGSSAAAPGVDPWLGLTAIGPIALEHKARDWALVLQSGELWHVVRYTSAGWVLLVRDEDYPLAAGSIDRYEAENRDWPPRRVRERPRHPPSRVAAVAFTALAVFFFFVTGPASEGGRWFQRGTAVADLVVGPEPWRAITALTLHADSAHVLGNVISGTVFASAVQRRLGTGGSALALVASGTLGNVANALWHHGMGHDHASIGASTAVFGAIGLLAATQVVLDRDAQSGPKRSLLQVIAPLIGGLALLGALGASPRADLGAHLFGFLGGAGIGLGSSVLLRGKPASNRPWVQLLLGALAAAIILAAWQLAFLRGAVR